MNFITSAILLAATLILFLKYRPRQPVSRDLCFLCGMMAAVTPLMPGGTWFLQAVSIATKGVVLFCCVFQLRREARCRRESCCQKNADRDVRPGRQTGPAPGGESFRRPAA